MKRRILSFVLVLAMVLSFVPVFAVAAEEEVKASPKAGGHTNAAHKCEECDSTDWTPWNSGSTLPTEGHYVLTSDITLTGEITMTGDLHICLNGYVLTGKGDRRLIGTKSNADTTLVITDCTAYTDEDQVYHAGALTGGVDTSTGGGGAIFVRRGGSCKVYDGRITGNMHKNDSAGGGAVMLQAQNTSYAGGKFYMYGGEITNNKAYKADGKTAVYGGAIYANTGTTVELEGVTVSGNTGTYGGAIYANTSAAVKITDSTVNGNTGTRGGAIYGSAATIQLKDTTLEDNNGGSGTVGLYSRSALTTENVTFTGNTTTNGSAVCAEGSSTVTLTDTTITGNTATSTTGSRSAAVYVVSATVKLSGKTVIAENTTQGAAIPDVVLDNASYDTLQIHELTEGSRVVFATPKTEPAEASEVIALDTTQTTPWQLGWVRYMTPSGSLKDIGLKGTEFVFGTYHYHGDQVYTPLTDASQLEAGGYYYLAEDVTLDSLANLQAKNLNLEICLNGHDLKSAEGKQVMLVTGNRNSTVTIDDCTAYTDANGVYHAGAITGADNTENGGAIYLGATNTLHLKNGKISGNKGGNGGAVIVFGTFRISGGELSDNKATKSGGAIYVNKNTAGGLIMTGGTIRDNSATTGGAVFVGVNTAVELGDVTVTGNTATAGGGAFAIGDNVTVKLTGTPKITGNTVSGAANNLRLAGGTMLQLEDLTDKASVGITLYNRTGDTLHFAENVTKDDSSCFVSDDAAYVVGYEDNKLLLKAAFEHIHCVCGDSACTEHTQVSYLSWEDATSLPTSGSYCLLTDVTVEEAINLTENVNLCLHGHTITQKAGSKAQMYRTQADAGVTLTISDCTAKTENGTYTAGSITGFVGTSEGSVMYLRAGTTLELFDGIFENNNAEGSGGAILINGEFKMYGGQFVGNRAGTATSGKNGGALYLNKDSVATITGGAFLNNSAQNGGAIYSMGHVTIQNTVFTGNTANEGGALYLRSSSTAPNTRNAVLENVTITGNTTKDTGAVHLLSSLGSLTLKGNVQIYGNTGKNLYLPKDYLFSAEEITADAKVGVTAQEMFEVISGPCADYAANFISDNTKLQIVYKDGALYLDASGDHKHCFCADESTRCDHEALTFVEWDDPTSLPTSGNYYLSVDVELPNQLYLENTQLNLCLNGHTVTLKTRMFYPKGETTLRILDCTDAPGKITGGTKSAILVDKNSTVAIELWNGIFTGNAGETAGGAILIQGNSTLKMYGGKITGNAVIGRLVTDENGNVLLKEDGSQQYVGHRGGGGVGVYGENTSFYMYGGEIAGNKVTSVTYLKKNGNKAEVGGDGGGVYVYKGSAYLYGGTITGNNAQLHGGGVFTSYGKLEIDGGTISGNTTAGGAGGFYASTGSTVLMKSGEVKNNTAKSSGGGIVAQGSGTVFTFAGGTVSGNQSTGSAAGILAQGKAEMVMTGGTVKGNASQSNGGGIYISTKSKLTMTGGTVSGNTSKGQGGGMYLNKATSTISGAYIAGNTSLNNTAGGLRMAGGTLTISGSQIVDNRSKSSGCGMVIGSSTNTENGVKVNYYANAYVYGCTFRGNVTEGSAGGLLVQSKGSQATISGCQFVGNQATSNGGGMYLSSNVQATVTGCKFIGNQANRGGSVYVNKCVATLKDLTVTENKGGMYITGVNCQATLEGAEIYKNTGSSATGIMVTASAHATITDTRIYENVATGTGGGLSVSSLGVAQLKNLDIYKNQAKTAGGFYGGAGSVVIAENLNIYENSATALGGGVYSGANLTMKNSVIRNNTAAENGGGVHTWKSSSRWTADDGATRLENCQIFGNSASGQGGGVFVHRGGPAQLTSVTIEDNSAGMEGGGIYCDGRMDMTDVEIRKNTSGGNGYAVYLTPAEYDGHSYFSGYKSIAGNTVIEDNAGGDLYLAEGIAVAINGATLGDDARICLTLSDGLLTQRVVGVYHYEGEGTEYVLTAGDRSITEPMAEEIEQAAEEQKESSTDSLLYVLVGLFAVIVVAVVAVLLAKKKKATKTGKEV